jgi:hypothetical protein
LIRGCGFEEDVGCGCHEFRQQMNQWGWLGCWTRRAEIAAWLVAKGAERGIHVDAATIPALIRAAIREHRSARRRAAAANLSAQL